MSDEIIQIPDIGSGSAEVIEICVAVGDAVAEDDSLIVLESDKASMEVPAPRAGKISEILIKVGDRVSEGTDFLKMPSENGSEATELTQTAAPSPPAGNTPKESTEAPAQAPEPQVDTASAVEDVSVPDIGAEDVPVIEICVTVGDTIEKDDALVVLESDKATMEVPSPLSGVVKEICVKEGDQMNQGDLLVKVETVTASTVLATAAKSDAPTVPVVKPAAEAPKSSPAPAAQKAVGTLALYKVNQHFHAGPAVRRLAREFGVNLALVKGTGPRHRIIKEDVQAYVKSRLSEAPQSQTQAAAGSGIPAVPAQDYGKWGEIETVALNRLRKVAAQNFQRSWLNVPHVTQFDKADITDLEAFRKANKALAEKKGTKLTPLPFFLKAVAYVLKEMPVFCSSLSEDGNSVIYKKYVNIGVAVDTPDGLLVPVIKDVDKKGIWDISRECIELAGKARDKKLKPAEMQGGCFTISSLGSVGGTAFTPIVNAPEVAILGISKAAMEPVWNGKDFDARLMCPLSLSYDHRVVNGADAARFTTMMSNLLADIRQLLL